MTSSRNEKWPKFKNIWFFREKTFQGTKNITMKKLEKHCKSHNWYFWFKSTKILACGRLKLGARPAQQITGETSKYQLWLIAAFKIHIIHFARGISPLQPWTTLTSASYFSHALIFTEDNIVYFFNYFENRLIVIYRIRFLLLICRISPLTYGNFLLISLQPIHICQQNFVYT